MNIFEIPVSKSKVSSFTYCLNFMNFFNFYPKMNLISFKFSYKYIFSTILTNLSCCNNTKIKFDGCSMSSIIFRQLKIILIFLALEVSLLLLFMYVHIYYINIRQAYFNEA